MQPPARRAGRPRCASTAPTRRRPRPGVLDAIADAERRGDRPVEPDRVDRPGARRARRARRGRRPGATDVVAVSPIVAGAALKGPADRLLRELGHESSVVGVARLYADARRRRW